MNIKQEKQGSWFARHKVLTGILAVIVLFVIIGAIGGARSGNTTVTSTPASSSNSTPKAPTTAKLGDTINVGGSQGLAVTLSQITDPASGADQFTTAQVGKRFVAVKLQVVNKGSGSEQDNANNDVTVIGSDNQSYTADISNVSDCTNFSNGSFTLSSGASATGCVVYQVPNGVKVSKVQFTPNSGFSGDTGEWVVQ